MQRRDERFELWLCDVLQLVNEQHEGRLGFLCSSSYTLEKRLEIAFQITVVGQTWLGFEVEAYFDVLVLDLEGLGKTPNPLSARSARAFEPAAGSEVALLLDQGRANAARERLPKIGYEELAAEAAED